MIKKLNFIAFLSLIFIGFVACSDNSIAPVDADPEIPELELISTLQTQIGTERTDVIDAELASNGVVILGAYKDLDSSCIGMKLFLAKVSFDGKELWKRKYSDIDASKCDRLDLVITDADEVVVFGATRVVETGDYDYHVYKFTTVGDLMWQQTIDYARLDIIISGTHKANGEIVAYPYETSSSTFRKVTLDTNGNILEDIKNPIFPGEEFSIFNTPSRKKIYSSLNESSTDLKVYDKNLQNILDTTLPYIAYINGTIDPQDGYFGYKYSESSFIKLNSNFEVEWQYKYDFDIASVPIQIEQNRYANISSRSYSPGNGESPVISVIEDGGQLLSRSVITAADGSYPDTKKALTSGNNDIIFVYQNELNFGVNVYRNNF